MLCNGRGVKSSVMGHYRGGETSKPARFALQVKDPLRLGLPLLTLGY